MNNRLLGLLISLLFLCLAGSVYAESVDDLEQWTIVTLDAHVTPKIRLYAEAQPRIGDNLTHMDRLLLRGSAGYQVTKNFSLWQGYGWTPSFENLYVDENRFTGKFNNENRIFQQALFENQWKKLKIVNRTRLEERFIENAGETAVRARHMLRLAHPIPKTKKWSLVVYDELFVNLNDTPRGPQAGFDQNRLFVGVNQKLSEYASAEIGYMNNPVNVFNHSTNRMNHIIMAGINFKL